MQIYCYNDSLQSQKITCNIKYIISKCFYRIIKIKIYGMCRITNVNISSKKYICRIIDITKFDKFQILNRNNFEFIICFIYIEWKTFNIDICFRNFFFNRFAPWSTPPPSATFSTLTAAADDLSRFGERPMTSSTCSIHHVNTEQVYFFDRNATFEKYFWVTLYVDCFTPETCPEDIWGE